MGIKKEKFNKINQKRRKKQMEKTSTDPISSILAQCDYCLRIKRLVKDGLAGEDLYFKSIDKLQIAILERELEAAGNG